MMFTGLKGVNVQLFLDDVCIATHTWSEHLNTLDRIYNIVKKANIKLNSKQCESRLRGVVSLGHKVLEAGIKQDPANLQAFVTIVGACWVLSHNRGDSTRAS